MLTELRKVGLIPVFTPGVTEISRKVEVLLKAGVLFAAFSPEDETGLQAALRVAGFQAGVTAVASAEQARKVAQLGAKFIALDSPSASQALWAQETDLICVPASQLPGGLSPVPYAVAQDEKSLTDFLKKEIRSMLSFDLKHVGINCPNEATSSKTADTFAQIFGFTKEDRGGAYFAGDIIEIMKKPFYGQHGHIAIATRSAESAAYYLEHAGVKFNWESAGYNPDGRLRVVYLQEEIGGFAVHILQR